MGVQHELNPKLSESARQQVNVPEAWRDWKQLELSPRGGEASGNGTEPGEENSPSHPVSEAAEKFRLPPAVR